MYSINLPYPWFAETYNATFYSGGLAEKWYLFF